VFIANEEVQGGILVTRQVPGDRCATCCVAHANFADESACPTGDSVWNEVVTIHRSQVVLKMLSSLHVDIFRN
jgi:hypothetical protein